MKPTIAIVVEGGMVSAVVTDRPGLFADVQCLVIDYDTDGADETALTNVPQSDGTISQAYAGGQLIERAEIDLAAVIKQLDAPERPEGWRVHHDLHGWYVVAPHEEEPASGYSLGFDGRPHWATEDEAWASI